MQFELKSMNYEDRKYTYEQSMQLKMQTESIGYLRGDFGTNGCEFYTSWTDYQKNLKTQEFQNEFNSLINDLRSSLLASPALMDKIGKQNPDSAMKGHYTTEYGFRIDSNQYTYLFRCNPSKGDYNFYVFCYVKEYLNRHTEKAREDIRFIDSSYNEIFRVADGERIRITTSCGETFTCPCRYIDSCHAEIGKTLWHICQFAEKMERDRSKYCPEEEYLPPYSYGLLLSSGELIKIDRYQRGYTPVKKNIPAGMSAADMAELMNKRLKVSKAQAKAMLMGSMFGWDCKAAKVSNYDENGKVICLSKSENK